MSRPLEVDVVVIGAGPAGMAAAEGAASAGAEVAVVDELATIGGNAAISTGYLAVVDSDMQRRAGITDSLEAFLEDARKQAEMHQHHAGLIWDEEITEMFATESRETSLFLEYRGVRFSRIISRPKQHSIDRIVAVEDATMLQSAFEPSFARSNIRTLFQTELRRLIMDGAKVRGVTVSAVSASGKRAAEFDLLARRGVVLACGGYQGNPEIRRRYQPRELAITPPLGLPNCRGIGHVVGAAAGGDLINMSMILPVVVVSSLLVEDAIAVNRMGKRFHDEAGPYGERVQALMRQPGGVAYYIVDGRVAGKRGSLLDQMPEPAISAPTLSQLAKRIGCDPSQLEATVADWNTTLGRENVRDPAFNRVVFPEARSGIVEGPFYAARMVIGTSFTWGGFLVTRAMQVVGAMGQPIAGLYAAGDTVGGLNAVSSLGGIHICGALTLGRKAGLAAAAGLSVAPHTRPMMDGKIEAKVNLRMPLFEPSGTQSIKDKR